jgi:putative redox protein
MDVVVRQLQGWRFEVEARGLSLIVDRLEEQGGPGDGFRPTELLLGALGACMMGTMLGFAENQSIPVESVEVFLSDEVAEHPKRIGRMRVEMQVGGEISESQAASLRRVAARCKIHSTLAGAPQVDFDFVVI